MGNNKLIKIGFYLLEVIVIASLIYVSIVNKISEYTINPLRGNALICLGAILITTALIILNKGVKGSLIASTIICLYYLTSLLEAPQFVNVFKSVLSLIIFVAFVVCLFFENKKWANIVCLVIVLLYTYEAFIAFNNGASALNSVLGLKTEDKSTLKLASVTFAYSAALFSQFVATSFVIGGKLLDKKEDLVEEVKEEK